jgi:hypothetical protein
MAIEKAIEKAMLIWGESRGIIFFSMQVLQNDTIHKFAGQRRTAIENAIVEVPSKKKHVDYIKVYNNT